MKKNKDVVSASQVLNMLEFLHAGITWLPEGKTHKTKIGSIDVTYTPNIKTLEFRAPLSWVNVEVPNEHTAKRLVSSIKDGLIEAKNTNSILECLREFSSDDSGIMVKSFWGL